jgi:hypothetical protein
MTIIATPRHGKNHGGQGLSLRQRYEKAADSGGYFVRPATAARTRICLEPSFMS